MIEEISYGDIRIGVNSENGQLCGIEKNFIQIMWGGGRDGGNEREKDIWPNSSPVMFPVVGPSSGIIIGGKNYAMLQHGIARHLPWEVKKGGEKICVSQEYDGKPVDVKHKGKEMKLQFPFSYRLDIKHEIVEDSVESEFSIRNKSNKRMPYDFGWHPGFVKSGNAKIITADKSYALKDVYESQTLLLEDVNEISLELYAGTIKLEHAFGNTMVWGPEGTNLVCLEPVTGLPERIDNGFIGSFGSKYLEPLERAIYKSKITPTIKI